MFRFRILTLLDVEDDVAKVDALSNSEHNRHELGCYYGQLISYAKRIRIGLSYTVESLAY